MMSVPNRHAASGRGALAGFLPAPLTEIQFLEIQLWQWVALFLLAAGGVLVAWVGSRLVHRVARSLARRTESRIDDKLVERIVGPLRMLVALALFAVGAAFLVLPERVSGFLGDLELGLVVVGVTWLVLRSIDIFAHLLEANLKEAGRRSAAAMLPLVRRGVKAFLLAVAVVALLQNVGFNVTGLLAGFGVGGLAIALAAQKSIANLFGGVSLIADQPVRVGDYCSFGAGKTGTVEEIGLRSTRIRTLDRTLVTIPNAEFSEIQIENFGARDRVRLHAVIGLRYETSPDQLRYVLAEMRKLLLAHPMVTPSPARVRFVGFGPHSLDLELFAYVGTSEWDGFLAVREDIFLRIMEIIREAGTGFAFPAQTLYLGRDRGLDEPRTREVEARVAAWRDRGELPFPEFSEDLIADLEGTVEYPPRGSVTRTEGSAT